MPTARNRIQAGGLALLAMTAVPMVRAHHGAAGFDPNQYVTIDGTVQEYRWGNPHIYLTIEVRDSAGKTSLQQVEAAPAAQLLSRGVTRDLLRVGERVSVRANPHRGGPGYAVLGY